jgi:hypothetical protein
MKAIVKDGSQRKTRYSTRSASTGSPRPLSAQAGKLANRAQIPSTTATTISVSRSTVVVNPVEVRVIVLAVEPTSTCRQKLLLLTWLVSRPVGRKPPAHSNRLASFAPTLDRLCGRLIRDKLIPQGLRVSSTGFI